MSIHIKLARVLWMIVPVLLGIAGCQKSTEVTDLRGKSQYEVAALVGEPSKIQCCSTEGGLVQTNSMDGGPPVRAYAIWHYSDGYVALARDGRVIESTPGLRRCEVRFPRGMSKETVRGVMGSPDWVSVVYWMDEQQVHELWNYSDGSVSFSEAGSVVGQYGRLTKADGPIKPLPAVPANWDKLARDMTGDQVRTLLGEPIKRVKHIYEKEKITFEGEYKYAQGTVGFDRDGRVSHWSYPAREGT